MPATRETASLLAVDRAVAELRRGRAVVITGGGGRAVLALGAEAATPALLEQLSQLSGSPCRVALTARRAHILKLLPKAPDDAGARVVNLSARGDLDIETVYQLADPLSGRQDASDMGLAMVMAEVHGCSAAAVGLAKVSRLLPAAVVAEVVNPDADDRAAWARRFGMLLIDAGDVFQYEHTSARTLKAISEARVPLLDAEDTRIIAFRPADGGVEHLAIVIGNPDPDQPVLSRLHSECFTGDLLGSLRCDCGDQLRGAIREIAEAGNGVLLYLAQEGRGIGLVNKLRAYALQDQGADTVDANEQLGFDADERVYLPAAEMLRQLGFGRVRLLTNNPAKVEALSNCGVEVVERVAHAFPSNRHNELYLNTKKARSGHLF